MTREQLLRLLALVVVVGAVAIALLVPGPRAPISIADQNECVNGDGLSQGVACDHLQNPMREDPAIGLQVAIIVAGVVVALGVLAAAAPRSAHRVEQGSVASRGGGVGPGGLDDRA